MHDNGDIAVLRDLARQVAEIAGKDIQDQRRDLWRRHNSLQRTRPLFYALGFPYWQEILPDEQLRCRDLLFRAHERSMRQMIYQDQIGDDSIIEPWITVGATYATPTGSRRWGPEIRHVPSPERRGAWKFDPPIKTEADLARLVRPVHKIDEAATARDLARMQDAVGDLITVNLDRGCYYRHWVGDLSTDLALLRGLEQMMWDMVDRPQWLHRLVGFLRDGVLAAQDQAEAKGDWRLCHHNNQAMPYSLEPVSYTHLTLPTN